jgi:hypothetical protein
VTARWGLASGRCNSITPVHVAVSALSFIIWHPAMDVHIHMLIIYITFTLKQIWSFKKFLPIFIFIFATFLYPRCARHISPLSSKYSKYFNMSIPQSASQSVGNTTGDLVALDAFGVRGSLIGVIISAVLYGIAVLISVACLRLLAKSRKIYDSKRRLTALCMHIGFMLACGTEALVSESWLTLSAIEQKLSLETIRAAASAVVPGVASASSSATVDLLPIALPLTVWGADGFLVRLSHILYLRALMTNRHKHMRRLLDLAVFSPVQGNWAR